MTWIIAIALLIALVAQLRGQTPYVTVGLHGSTGLGYNAASPAMQPGIEYKSARMLSLTQGSYSPRVYKNSMTGWSGGFSTRNYARVNRWLLAGGGLEYAYLSTPAWSKSSVWAVAGAAFPLGRSRLYLDYLYPLYDHNHVQSARATVEFGSARFRPTFGVGLVRFSQPYDCAQCTVSTGAILEAGVRIMLGKMEKP